MFHATVKRNGKRNHIPAVVREDGTITIGPEEFVVEILSFNQGLLRSDMHTDEIDSIVFDIGPRVPDVCLDDLEWIVTNLEINTAVFMKS